MKRHWIKADMGIVEGDVIGVEKSMDTVVGVGLIVLLAGLLAVVTVYIRRNYWLNPEKPARKSVYFAYGIITFVCWAALSYALLHFAKGGTDILSVAVRYVCLSAACYLLAWIDYYEKRIPNRILVILLVTRIVLLVWDIALNPEYWLDAIKYPVVGLLIGLIVILAGHLVYRQGVGMGDVKLLGVVGFFVGSTQILSVLFNTFLFAAVFGIALLILGKAKLKDSFPFAPFVCAGAMANTVLLMIGDIS